MKASWKFAPREMAAKTWATNGQLVVQLAVWAIVLVLCAYSTDNLKGFIESVGDLGPVIVAWLVYQLGRDQHRTQTAIAERDHKRQLLAARADIVRRLERLASAVKFEVPTFEQASEARDIVSDATPLFSDAALAPLAQFATAINSAALSASLLARISKDDERRARLESDLKDGRTKIWRLDQIALKALRASTRID